MPQAAATAHVTEDHMATRKATHDLELPRARSRDAALLLAALDDQSRLMFDDLRGATAAELAWQPRRGANSIGMLLVHLALVEVYWLAVAAGRFTPEAAARARDGVRGLVDREVEQVLGLPHDADGMPFPASGLAPRALRGWTLARFRRLHERARRHVRRRMLAMRDADLGRRVERTRLSGERTTQTVRWILYHVLEHFSGHYGQVLLLRHLYRDRRRAR